MRSTWCNAFSDINSMPGCLELITTPPAIMAFITSSASRSSTSRSLCCQRHRNSTVSFHSNSALFVIFLISDSAPIPNVETLRYSLIVDLMALRRRRLLLWIFAPQPMKKKILSKTKKHVRLGLFIYFLITTFK